MMYSDNNDDDHGDNYNNDDDDDDNIHNNDNDDDVCRCTTFLRSFSQT
jgi:hypothetical protein